MNHDRIFQTFNAHEVAYLLIGGLNFFLRHAPVLTYDVDLWVEDTPANVARCERALAELQAQWGRADDDWGPVAEKRPGWLEQQGVYCLLSPFGAIDIFRSVEGLESWSGCRARAERVATDAGIVVFALADVDMLQCQLALPEGLRKQDRIRTLEQAREQRGR